VGEWKFAELPMRKTLLVEKGKRCAEFRDRLRMSKLKGATAISFADTTYTYERGKTR
jgi:hypothetical protein